MAYSATYESGAEEQTTDHELLLGMTKELLPNKFSKTPLKILKLQTITQ